MPDNDETKKDSLDEILSDLNNILDKMPEMLDGAKLPEGAAAPAQVPEACFPQEAAVPENPEGDGNFERMIDLKEIGKDSAPAVVKPEAQPELAAPAAGGDKLVVQSLGESMFSGGAEEAPAAARPEPAAAVPVTAAETPAPTEPVKPPVSDTKEPGSAFEKALIKNYEPDTPEAKKEAAAHAGASLFAATRDFGIPDIDMLLQMSQGGGAAPQAAPSVEPAVPQAQEAAPVQPEAVIESFAPQAETAEPAGVIIEPAAEAVQIQSEAAPVQPETAAEIPAPQAGDAAEIAYAEEIKGLDGLIIDSEPAAGILPGQAQQEAQPGDAQPAAEGGTVEFKEEDLKKEEAEQTPAPAAGASPDPAGVIDFGAEEAAAPQPEEDKTMVIPPSGEEPQGEPSLVLGSADAAQQPDEEKTMVILPSGEEPQIEPSLVPGNADAGPAPAPQEESPLVQVNSDTPFAAVEPQADAPLTIGTLDAVEPVSIDAPVPQPEEEKTMLILPSGGEPQIEPSLVLGNADAAPELTVNTPSPQPEEEKTMLILPSGTPPQGEPSLVLGNADAAPELTVNAPQGEPSLVLGSADPVLSVNAPAQQPEEEKTVVFQPGMDFGATTRRADLGELSAKAMPETIPENRQRALALLYNEEDKDLCANTLAELDAICAKSQSKPMFIKRAFVKPCEVGMNGNFVLQMATDAKANGLLCVGAIPQETVYEIENALTSSGLLFKHVQRESFSHSAMLDVVTELILK